MKTQSIKKEMINYADRLLARFGYFRLKFNQNKFSFSERDTCLEAIKKTLHANLQAGNLISEELMMDLSLAVYEELDNVSQLSIKQQAEQFYPEFIGNRMLLYIIACGVASHWELNVKILAEKLKIPVFSDSARKGQKSPGFRDLDSIITEIKQILPKMDLQLSRVKNLRDCLVHGNFHQLQSHASESQPKKIREQLKGSVWKMSLISNNESIQMHEIKDLEEIKKIGIFGWFLNAASSEVLENLIIDFKTQTYRLQDIIRLHSLSLVGQAMRSQKSASTLCL